MLVYWHRGTMCGVLSEAGGRCAAAPWVSAVGVPGTLHL